MRARARYTILLAASAAYLQCSSYNSPTGAGGNLCSRISYSSQGISVTSAAGCTATTGGLTNQQFDQFARVLSFDFDITCTAGASERIYGRVFNVTYNGVGEIQTLQATINGQSCSIP